MTKVVSCHKFSSKKKESSKVAYFGTNFALTEDHENLRDRKSEVWSGVWNGLEGSLDGPVMVPGGSWEGLGGSGRVLEGPGGSWRVQDG